MHAVRKRILDILKECGGATVSELAGQLEMAPVSVRHHLDILQGDDLICVDRLERKGSVGRPQQIYGLTAEASQYFPNDFAALAGRLVEQLKRALPPEEVRRAFCQMAHETAAELCCDGLDAADLPLEERVERVAEFLSSRGYLATWEATDDGGYILHKHNCPYAEVSSQHDELCLMDQVLVDTLLDQSCRRVESMANDNRCSYQVDADDVAVSKMASTKIALTFESYEGEPNMAVASSV